VILIVKREVLRATILHQKVNPRELLLGVFCQHLHHDPHRLVRLNDKVNQPLGPLCPNNTLHGFASQVSILYGYLITAFVYDLLYVNIEII
jgi:hypothetical protein